MPSGCMLLLVGLRIRDFNLSTSLEVGGTGCACVRSTWKLMNRSRIHQKHSFESQSTTSEATGDVQVKSDARQGLRQSGPTSRSACAHASHCMMAEPPMQSTATPPSTHESIPAGPGRSTLVAPGQGFCGGLNASEFAASSLGHQHLSGPVVSQRREDGLKTCRTVQYQSQLGSWVASHLQATFLEANHISSWRGGYDELVRHTACHPNRSI